MTEDTEVEPDASHSTMPPSDGAHRYRITYATRRRGDRWQLGDRVEPTVEIDCEFRADSEADAWRKLFQWRCDAPDATIEQVDEETSE